jgi:hypothetical protein
VSTVKKFTVFFKIQLKKNEIDIILKEFLNYFQKEKNNLLMGISKPTKSHKGTWKITITAKAEDINYICRKFIDFLNREDYLDTNTKVIYVSVSH